VGIRSKKTKAENQPKKIMKANYRIIQYCAPLVLAALGVQLSSAYAQGVFTNWNDLVTNWVETSAPCGGGSIASSSDGTKLAAGVRGGGIWISTNGGVTWTQTSAPDEGWTSIASSWDGTKLAGAVDDFGGIHTSTDGGVTWTLTRAPSKGWDSIASSSDGTKLAAADGGIWTAQATIQTNPPSLTNIVVTPANPVIADGSNVPVTATGQISDGPQTNLTSTNGQH
jgi:hypothetical protein